MKTWKSFDDLARKVGSYRPESAPVGEIDSVESIAVEKTVRFSMRKRGNRAFSGENMKSFADLARKVGSSGPESAPVGEHVGVESIAVEKTVCFSMRKRGNRAVSGENMEVIRRSGEESWKLWT